jgi:hypothetical protein
LFFEIGELMTPVILVASSLLAVLLALALVREMRIRRALERLLSRLLALWRHPRDQDPSQQDRKQSASGDHSGL